MLFAILGSCALGVNIGLFIGGLLSQREPCPKTSLILLGVGSLAGIISLLIYYLKYLNTPL